MFKCASGHHIISDYTAFFFIFYRRLISENIKSFITRKETQGTTIQSNGGAFFHSAQVQGLDIQILMLTLFYTPRG
jgi:hypothetical protein